MLQEKASPTYRRDLGDGLLLRWSTIEDTEDIVHLTSMVFRFGPDEPPAVHMVNLMREAMSGHFPLMSPGDFAVVEDTRRTEHRLVACTCLWWLTWEYEGIPFVVGRPEIVATEPDYRNRGLVRAVFELIHARSEAQGHLVQAITGIPYFYRQFGYEYAIDDLRVRKETYFSLIPPAKAGTPEPYTLRDATTEDVPFIQSLYDRSRAIYSVSTRIDEGWWRYQLRVMRRLGGDVFWIIQMIIDTAGAPVGYVLIAAEQWQRSIPILDLAIAPGVNWQAVMPPLLRALQAQSAGIPTNSPEPADTIRWNLGRKHPLYEVLGKELVFEYATPYAWYVRVPNLPAFIRHIAPVLERRLANSALAGYSGTLTLNFYRGGLQLVFDKGLLAAAKDWRASVWNSNEDSGFPPLVFLQLLFGYRSLDELRHAFPDVWAKNEVELLLKTLFPANVSWAIPLG